MAVSVAAASTNISPAKELRMTFFGVCQSIWLPTAAHIVYSTNNQKRHTD